MLEPEIRERTLRPEGSAIAYRVYNARARKTVVLSNGLGCGDTLFRHLIDDLGKDHRVVTWDYRGLFDSTTPRGSRDLSARALAGDLAAVQRAAGAEAASHVGFATGASVVLTLWSEEPSCCERLVLLQGGVDLEELRLAQGWQVLRRSLAGATALGPLWARGLLRSRRAFDRAYVRGLRSRALGATCARDDFRDILQDAAKLDAATFIDLMGAQSAPPASVLSQVSAPTLVFGARRDPIYPEQAMRRIHELIQDSEYAPLTGATHACLLEMGPIISARVRRFFAEHPRRSSQQTSQ